jgi:hypothetical protein
VPETAEITEAKKLRSGLTAWFMSGRDLSVHDKESHDQQHPWFAVMWLTGVDYFSSIAYQAGIALLAAGILAPVATVVLVFVTLFCAVPVYREVARRSYAGQGSIALLEHLVKGWSSKLLVLVLLGFAGTDFVITKGWTSIFIASCFVFPRLALGLSGFETGVSVMPLIRGDGNDPGQPADDTGELQDAPEQAPQERIKNTGWLLLTAAVLMSVLLIGSSIVTTVLIPESAYREGGAASGRAMAYLAHRDLGTTFGSLYDVSTILILWFAGASAMAGLLNLIPRYLPRFGMSPRWVSYARRLVLVLFAIDLAVTLVFRGSVERQGGAYATGVLVLIFSAAVAAALGLWRDAAENGKGKGAARVKSVYFWACAAVFAYTLGVNIKERPDGIIIASIFISLLILSSVVSRYFRSTELRVKKCDFYDPKSELLWDQLADGNLNIIPIASLDEGYRSEIRNKIEKNYKVEGPLTFLYVNLLDDRSDFYEQLEVKVERDAEENLITIYNANVVANTIAYVSIRLKARNIILGLPAEKSPLVQAFRYLSFGTGEVGLMVYEILTNYWKERPEVERPTLFLMMG